MSGQGMVVALARRKRCGRSLAEARHVTASVLSLDGVTDSGLGPSMDHGPVAGLVDDSKDHEMSGAAERRRMERA
jgi:hypothetical protein